MSGSVIENLQVLSIRLSSRKIPRDKCGEFIPEKQMFKYMLRSIFLQELLNKVSTEEINQAFEHLLLKEKKNLKSFV